MAPDHFAPAQALETAYAADSGRLFGAIAHLPWAAFLDSGHPHYPQARYDILTATPRETLSTFGPVTRWQAGGETAEYRDDPFTLLARRLRASSRPPQPLPFVGGALGYFAYDLGRRVERLPTIAAADCPMPDMAIGIYDWALVVDHQARRSWLAGDCPAGVRTLLERPGPDTGETPTVIGPIASNMDRAAYARAFARIQRYIRDGDCYQVNLARRFSVPLRGDPWRLYRHMRKTNPAPHGAFLSTPYGAVLSASPERFLELRGRQAQTRPIKGTRPRDPDPDRDRELAAALRGSPKDRAENIMIVDLLRNDLGRTCVPGSVEAPALLDLESFSNVHHLVSTVTGRLRAGLHPTDLLRGCFPGGSITGAPKVRAMQIIEELEPQRRGVYCGSVGYIGYDGDMDSNIAIRTLVYSNGAVRFWAGGGIVADSDMETEYQEILDKADGLLRLFSGLGAKPQGEH